jgi:hypothetical protein
MDKETVEYFMSYMTQEEFTEIISSKKIDKFKFNTINKNDAILRHNETDTILCHNGY